MTIIGLYLWTHFIGSSKTSELLAINTPTLVLAIITAITCIVTYIWTPEKAIPYVSTGTYLLVTATVAVLIVTTDGTNSPFIALWMLIGIFASLFGVWGALPMLIATSVFVAFQYVDKSLTNEVIVIIAVSSMLPIIAGSILWHGRQYDDATDNKEYRNLANELSEVASKSEVVINAIGDGVIAIDYKGVIQLINPAAQTMIGWGKQDALALNYKTVLQLFSQKNEPLSDAADPIRQVLNNNQQVRTNDCVLITKSGKKVMISLVVSPVGEIGSGVIAVFRDITKEKMEEREQAEFISTASHEMRTPVASIEGYLGLALNPQTAQIDTRARDFILKAHQSAEHLGHLFQDLLDVSKADDGRLSNNPKVVDLTKFARDIVLGLEQKANQKGIDLVYKPIPKGSKELHLAPVYFVNLDNDHIREIINNLVENAIKYTPSGKVIVDITGDDDHSVLSVKDSGIGIPAEDMPHLFQKFYRVDNKDTREIGGTGLGLYICRRLAEIMGGRVWAESTRGKGSTFFVELPRISMQEANRLVEQESLKISPDSFPSVTQANLINNAPSQKIDIVQPMSPNSTQQAQVLNQAPTRSIPIKQSAPPTIATNPQTLQNNIPRTQQLTPEQIAAYVAKQRALAQQQNQANPQQRQQPVNMVVNRPQQSVFVPVRGKDAN